jgi:hypothetical protein
LITIPFLCCTVVAKAKEEFAKYRDVREAVHQYEGRLVIEDDDARMMMMMLG